LCCDAGDTVKTKFKVEPGHGAYPEDRWYALINGQWKPVPPDKIVPGYAPDGQAILFMAAGVILCFVRLMMRAPAVAAVALLALSPARAGMPFNDDFDYGEQIPTWPQNKEKREWPDGPVKNFLKNLQRPDNDKHPERLYHKEAQSCCDAGDVVKT
jgi:hypothetical protein